MSNYCECKYFQVTSLNNERALGDLPARSLSASSMRRYGKALPGGLELLFRGYGSGVPRALPFGVLAAVYVALLESYQDDWAGGTDEMGDLGLFAHPYPYAVVAFITGFGLIFRLNFSYQRYWEAPRAAAAHSVIRGSRGVVWHRRAQ